MFSLSAQTRVPMRRSPHVHRNRHAGAAFESVFIFRAERCGMLALKNWSTCRFLAQGKVQVIHGELDFKLFDKQGRVAFLDAKSFEGDRFARSKLDRHQVVRAKIYNECGITAGFVVLFGGSKDVCFFSGLQIYNAKIGSGFGPEDGVFLGKELSFHPGLVFDSRL